MAQLSLGKELGGWSLSFFLLSYHRQLLKVWLTVFGYFCWLFMPFPWSSC